MKTEADRCVPAIVIRRRGRAVIGAALVALCCLAGGSALAQQVDDPSADMLAIQGRWARSDGHYLIELTHAGGDSLEAAYFNPRPINVDRTEKLVRDGVLHVMRRASEIVDARNPGTNTALHGRISDY